MLEGRLLLDSKRPSAIDKCLSISEVIEGGLEAYFHRPPRLDYLSSKVLEFHLDTTQIETSGLD